jgi:hypothetical protein
MRRVLLFLSVLLCADGLFAQNRGFPMYGSFENGSFDSVNLQNLNTFFSIPVVSENGRGMNFQMAIVRNSLIWQNSGNAWTMVYKQGWGNWPVGTIPYSYTTGTCTYFVNGRKYTQTTYNYFGYSYVEPDGTSHAFGISFTMIPSPCPGHGTIGSTTGYATDSSGYYVNATSPTAPVVYTPGGIQIATNGTVTDTNGNYISYAPNGQNENDWTDTAGRLVLKIILANATTSEYEYQDTTGTYQAVTWNTAYFNIKTNFGCSGVSEYTATNVELLTSLVFPNGLTYSFTYEPTPGNSGYVTARIQKVTLPNGGTVTYTFGTTNDGINCSDGTVVNLTRAIYDGTNTATWTFTRAQNGSNWQTTVTAPQMPYDSAANQTVYTFNSSGQETQRQIYQGSVAPANLLRTINTTWASNGSPATKSTILEDNQTQSEVETSYDSYANLLSLKEHDFGSGAPGSILRTTAYTYLSTSAYTNLNILNRATEKTVADSTGTTKYREDSAYDGTTISPCPTGAAHHDDSGHGCTLTTRGNPTTFTTYTDA